MQRRAAEVFERPIVQAEIAKVKNRQADQFDLEAGQIKRILATVANKCIRDRIPADPLDPKRKTDLRPVDPKAVVAALAEINRMNGNHAPVRSEVSGKDGGPIVVRDFNDFYNDEEANGNAKPSA